MDSHNIINIYRLAVVTRLVLMRLEWQDAAASDGKNLTEVQTPVGIILSDFCDALEFTPEERLNVLGEELAMVTA